MALQCPLRCRCSISVLTEESKLPSSVAIAGFVPLLKDWRSFRISSRTSYFSYMTQKFPKLTPHVQQSSTQVKASKLDKEIDFDDGKEEDKGTHESDVDNGDKSYGSNAKTRGKSVGSDDDDDGPLPMSTEERRELRRKIRDVIDMNPDVKEEDDPVERRKKMEKLLADYPLVVDEEDPDWPEDADGWGFNLSQFFNKITIKNVRKDDDDDYDSDKELVWQDDNYIRPIKDITIREWEETVFKDISPLIILVHHRYKRPLENEKMRDELVKAVQIFWDSRLPSPRCVAVDAVVELDLVASLDVTIFPEVIFTKAGKILYRDKDVRTADEWSRIMAFFYYGAARPPCLNKYTGDKLEAIPSIA